MSLPGLLKVVKTGQFPHQMYVAPCDCPSGQPVPTKNYAGHVVGPPKCSSCKLTYRLDTKLIERT